MPTSGSEWERTQRIGQSSQFGGIRGVLERPVIVVKLVPSAQEDFRVDLEDV